MKNNIHKHSKHWHKVFIVLLFLFITPQIFSQQKITGKITDESGTPLPGASVMIKGTVRGTVANLEGSYSIDAGSQEDILVFSFIGYEEKEIVAGTNTNINVILAEETETLDEVVVIGYGRQKKIDLSGSVAVVNMDDLEELPINSAGEALKGRVSGVLVTSNSGQPGADPSIIIRGKSSISLGNGPLVVVDGVPGVSLGDVDFRDVVSASVLKDAASAAIYGSAGANGVILITTKRGTAGKTKIDFKSYIEWKTPPKPIDLLNSQQALDLIREIDTAGTISGYLSDQYITNISIDTSNLVYTNWQDQLFLPVAPTQNYSLSFSGGNENLRYRISGTYLDNVGYIRPSSNNRFTLRSNLDYTFSDKLKMVTDFSLIRETSKNVATGDFAWNGTSMLTALNTLPFIPIKDSEGKFFINPFQPNIDIPNAGIADDNSFNYGSRLTGKYGLYYEIFDGLSYTFEVMPSIRVSKNQSYTSKYYTFIGRSIDGRANSSSGESLRIDMNNMLTYRKALNKHNIETMAGFVMLRSSSAGNNANGSGFITDEVPFIINTTKTNGNSSFNEYAKYSYIGRINYNFNAKYYLQANIRADGSSRFGENYQWGTFPSASMAWRISEENFMENLNAVEELKLRGTFGITGNDGFSNYLNVSTFRSGANYPIWGTDDVAAGFRAGSPYNPNLKWEEQLEKSVGIDLILWNGRLDFSAEMYSKNSYDLLYNAQLPINTGFRTGWVNIGEVESKGYDLRLTTRNISTKDFSWLTNFTFSGNQSRVKSLGQLKENQFSGRYSEYIITPGEWIDAFYGWKTEGIYQNVEQVNQKNTTATDGSPIYYQNELTEPGDLIFTNTNGYETDSLGNQLVDINGDPIQRITPDDRVILGKPDPDFFFGMDNSFKYKNIDFGIFIQGVYGNDILSLTRMEIERMDHYFNYSATVANRWKYEDQETDIPRASLTDPNENNRVSNRWLEDGSYLRIKYVTIGYTIPEAASLKIGVSQARIYFTVNNLYTLTNYSLYDPEIATNGKGEDMGGYPQAKSYVLGISLGF
jgi:TonB-linked SusC/RagA family outer membrane protein